MAQPAVLREEVSFGEIGATETRRPALEVDEEGGRPPPPYAEAVAEGAVFPGATNLGGQLEDAEGDEFAGLIDELEDLNGTEAVAQQDGDASTMKARPVLMDSVHDSTFGFREFVHQMSLHTFWPLSLLWYRRDRWPQGARNQFLLTTHPTSLVWHSTPMLCWTMLAIYMSKKDRFRSEKVSVHDLFTVPFLLGLSRIVLIAIKYASLSKAELNAYFTERNRATVLRWMLQTQLISGWLAQRDDIIRAELNGAASRLSLDLTKLYFVVEPLRQAHCVASSIASVKAWEVLARLGSLNVSKHEFFSEPGAPSAALPYDLRENRDDDDDDAGVGENPKKRVNPFSHDAGGLRTTQRTNTKRVLRAPNLLQSLRSTSVLKPRSLSERRRLDDDDDDDDTNAKAAGTRSSPKSSAGGDTHSAATWRSPELYGTRHIRCELVILVLLRAARSKAPIIPWKQGIAFAVVLAVLPRFLGVIVEENAAAFFGARTGPALFRPNTATHRGESDDPDYVVLACVCMSVVVTSMVGIPFVIFMSTSVAHYYRTYMVHRWLALLIRPSFHAHPHFPQIQLCTRSRYGAHNVVTWVHCRSIMCFFGKRYEKRLDSYMLLVSFLAVVAIIIPFLQLLSAGSFGGGSDDDELRDDLTRMRQSSFVWTSIFLVSTTSLMLTATIVFASYANQELESALGSLTHHRLSLHSASVNDWMMPAHPPPDQLLRRRATHNAEAKREVDPTLPSGGGGSGGPVLDRSLGSGVHHHRQQHDALPYVYQAAANRGDMVDEFEDTLQLAKEELDVLNRIHVLRVLGQPAEMSLALSVATTATTIIGYVLGALFLLFV